MISVTDAVILERLLWLFVVLAPVVIAARLFSSGLWRSYVWLLGFLFLLTARDAVLFATDARSRAYGAVYFASLPLCWFACVGALVELYAAALSAYPGIARWIRRILWVGGAAALAGSCVIILPDSDVTWLRSRTFNNLFSIHRVLLLGLTLFHLLGMAVLSRYPLYPPRNLTIHGGILFLYLLVSSATYFLLNASGAAGVSSINLLLLALCGLCLIGWATLLQPAGELRPSVPALVPGGSEERLLQQLRDVNAVLARIGRV